MGAPERQKKKKKSNRLRLEKQELCKYITLFCTFLCRHCTTTTRKCLVSITFCGGIVHDTGVTFAPGWVYSGSFSWLYICLHDTTTKLHASASHPAEFTPVVVPGRNLATVSCKRETTTRFGVKSPVCRQTGTGSARVMFVILKHTCILEDAVYLQITRYEMTQSSCKRHTKLAKIVVANSLV